MHSLNIHWFNFTLQTFYKFLSSNFIWELCASFSQQFCSLEEIFLVSALQSSQGWISHTMHLKKIFLSMLLNDSLLMQQYINNMWFCWFNEGGCFATWKTVLLSVSPILKAFPHSAPDKWRKAFISTDMSTSSLSVQFNSNSDVAL